MIVEHAIGDGLVVGSKLPQRERIGKYELCVRGPSGGMATVYLAIKHGASGFRKPVAIKRIHPHLVEDASLREMFAAEARVVSLVEHPFVCRVEDFGEENGSPYLVMEYLVGESLHAVFKAIYASHPESKPTLALIARVIADLAEALHAVHEATDEDGIPLNVVHRDVSPSNLFMLFDGSVRLTDFGIARTRTAIQHTATGTLKGKLSYMSPEHASGKPLDRRSDIFSLGIVMWEFITNRRLYRAPTDLDVLKLAAEARIPTFAEKDVSVPTALEAVVMRCLAKSPDDRYATARELSEALHDVVRSELGHARTAEVAAFMGRLFPGELERKRALIRSAVARPVTGAEPMAERVSETSMSGAVPARASLPEAPPPRPGSPRPFESEHDDVPTRPVVAAAPVDPNAVTRRDVRRRSEPPSDPHHAEPPTSRAFPLVLAATVTLFVGWGAFIAAVPDGRVATPAATRTAAAPSARTPRAEPKPTMPSETAAALPGATTTSALRAEAPDDVRTRARPRAASQAPRERETRPVQPVAQAPAPVPTPAAEADARGQAYVTTRGFTAEVSSGGRSLGRTPLRAQLPVGTHTLVVRHPETGASQSVQVEIERGRVVFVALGGD